MVARDGKVPARDRDGGEVMILECHVMGGGSLLVGMGRARMAPGWRADISLREVGSDPLDKHKQARPR